MLINQESPAGSGITSNIRAQEFASLISNAGASAWSPHWETLPPLESQPPTAALLAASKLYPGHVLVLNPGIPNVCLCPSYIFAVPQCTQSRGRAWADPAWMAGGAELLRACPYASGIQPSAPRKTLSAQGIPCRKERQKRFCFSASWGLWRDLGKQCF